MGDIGFAEGNPPEDLEGEVLDVAAKCSKSLDPSSDLCGRPSCLEWRPKQPNLRPEERRVSRFVVP